MLKTRHSARFVLTLLKTNLSRLSNNRYEKSQHEAGFHSN
ncbi:hypothetical protein VIBHAR_06283 [Vibrio campbellii ATCC BAA-1116]|uniref:Uncharacterized protein n=1 Tax=Vibrio campbellii (strain ATCC BAA-1116) TaxID=2902295 RepID=A7N6I1_VIBC1|nr:hypothetical protein VIBHAR_06283 [Vibrio campbellii ATCC BAA-1116]